MEDAELERIRQRFERLVAERLPSAPIHHVVVLQHGDDPAVEPGQLLARVVIDSGASREEGEQSLQAFATSHRAAIRELRPELNDLPEVTTIEFVTAAEEGSEPHGPRLRLGRPRGEIEPGGAALTPVMARLGPADLETVDILISAGIAANRAEAVRWALARIRERPAYQKLRERVREIEELTAQF